MKLRLLFFFLTLSLPGALHPYEEAFEEAPSWHGAPLNPIDEDDYGASLRSFCSISGRYESIASSDLKERAGCDKIGLKEGEISFSYTRFLNRCDALAFGIGYHRTYLKWDPNPFFHKRSYNSLSLSASALTKRLCGWEWQGNATAWINTKEMDLCQYSQYQLSLWGRYQFCCDCIPPTGIHLGAIAKLGLEKSSLYPIFGLDFDLASCWKAHLIYPVNLSIEYLINSCWSLEGAVTFWDLRHRLGKNEPESKGIFEYRNTGINLGINFNWCEIASANLHLGSTLGEGDLVIYNSRGRDSHHNKFKAAPYIGGDFMVNF